MENVNVEGFGFHSIMAEGKPWHPDSFKNSPIMDDDSYIRQLKAYSSWRGIVKTKLEPCSRPHLLDKI